MFARTHFLSHRAPAARQGLAAPLSAIARAALVCGLAGTAGVAIATEYGTVVSSTPVNVQVPVPQTQCVDQQQAVQPAPSGGGALLGALIGGAVGHNVGGGFGRAAATGLGVVAGAAVGNQIEANATPATVATVRQCSTVTGYQTRTIGYDVAYDYNGQRYTTRLAQPPGERIALNVAVTPAGAAAAVAPVPAVTEVAVAQPATVVYGPAGYYAPYGGPSVVVAPSLVFGGYWGHYRWR